MFDHILLVLLLLADGLCWYEARRSGNVMKAYFLERKRWYAARAKTNTPPTVVEKSRQSGENEKTTQRAV